MSSSLSVRGARDSFFKATPVVAPRFDKPGDSDSMYSMSIDTQSVNSMASLGSNDSSAFVGVANCVEQISQCRKEVTTFFNIMVVGPSGTGKSTFVNTFFECDIYDRDHPSTSARAGKTVAVEKQTILLKDKMYKVKLSLIDTPGYAEAVDNTECWKPIVDYIDAQFNKYLLDVDGIIHQVSAEDTRVHCCFFFLEPGKHLKALDIEVLQALHKRVNIIPVIAKADTMTAEELRDYKRVVQSGLISHNISVFSFPDLPAGRLTETRDEVKKLLQRQPFAIIASNTRLEIGGRRVRARRYPWGTLETETSEQNDLAQMRTLVISKYKRHLVDTTHDDHYGRYRYNYLCPQGHEQGETLGIDPLTRVFSDQNAMDNRLKVMESEMEQVFIVKVQEKKKKLKERNLDLSRRQEQTRISIERDRQDISERREAFLVEKKDWEKLHAHIEEQLRSPEGKKSLKKLNLLTH